MPRKPLIAAAVATIGIDIGKNTFHLVGLDKRGAIALRQKLSRSQVEVRLANFAPCLIGMEACVGGHHLGRRLNSARYILSSAHQQPPRRLCRSHCPRMTNNDSPSRQSN
jgi:hypothetical protein